MSYGAQGCVLALALAAYFDAVGVPLLEIFGPSYVVYFLRAVVRKGVKGATFNTHREYIGFTQKPPEERAKEHMDDFRKKVTGALWLDKATIEGAPIVTEGPLAGSVCLSTVPARNSMFAPGCSRQRSVQGASHSPLPSLCLQCLGISRSISRSSLPMCVCVWVWVCAGPL